MRRWRAVVATGLATLLLAACGARPAHESAPTTAPPARTSTTTAAPSSASASAATTPYDWSRASLPALGGGKSATISALLPPAESGGYWSVVGTATGADGTTTATIWTSQDGQRWTREALSGVDGRALAATSDGSATVVVGSVGSGASQRAAVWMTPPGGGTPQPVADQASLQSGVGSRSTESAGPSEMDLVAAGTIGIVASGSVAGQSALWYSSDGSTWSQEPSAERLVADRRARLTSLLVYPGGALASGVAQDGTEEVGVMWSSADGIRWDTEPAGALSPPGAHAVTGATWTGQELVTVGGTRSSSSWVPTAWVSPGVGASSASIEDFPSASGTLRAVAVDPTVPRGADAIVAVGGPAGDPQAFESADGETWTSMSMPSPPAAEGSATADLVGTWGGTTLVADSQAGQPLVWVHHSGRWMSVPPATFGGTRPTAEPVAVTDAAGRLWLAVDLDRPSRSPASVAVILDSTSGAVWSQASVIAGARLSGLATTADGHLVATGVDETTGEAAVWTSATGGAWRLRSTLGAGASPTAVAAFGGGGAAIAVGSVPLDGHAAPTAAAWRLSGSPAPVAQTLETTPTVDPVQPLGLCSDTTSTATSATSTTAAPTTTANTSTASGSTPGSASITPTLVAVGWSTRTGSPPTSTRPPTTTTTIPLVGSSAGTAGQEADGTEAASWSTTNGVTWSRSTVSPRPGVGSEEEMVGCAATPDGFVAWGQATGPTGSQPALWTSTDGQSWTRVLPAGRRHTTRVPLGPGGPWTSLAVSGSDWLAVGGDPPTELALPADPAWSTTAADPLTARAATTAYGSGGVWLSTDSGAHWQLLSADRAPWSGAQLSTTVATWAGPSPVVAGDDGGALAVWVGTPAVGSGSTGTGTTGTSG